MTGNQDSHPQGDTLIFPPDLDELMSFAARSDFHLYALVLCYILILG